MSADKLLLVLSRVAAHEHSVYGLTARVADDSELAEVHCATQVTEFEVDRREPLQRLQVQVLEAALLGQVPVTGAVVLEQRPRYSWTAR